MAAFLLPHFTGMGCGFFTLNVSLTTHTTMVSCTTLPSDLDFIDIMHDLPDKSDSDDDFDGSLDPEDGPIVYYSTC